MLNKLWKSRFRISREDRDDAWWRLGERVMIWIGKTTVNKTRWFLLLQNYSNEYLMNCGNNPSIKDRPQWWSIFENDGMVKGGVFKVLFESMVLLTLFLCHTGKINYYESKIWACSCQSFICHSTANERNWLYAMWQKVSLHMAIEPLSPAHSRNLLLPALLCCQVATNPVVRVIAARNCGPGNWNKEFPQRHFFRIK